MTYQDFNEKYKNYLEEGHYGLSFDIPSVTSFLDDVFKVLIYLDKDFKYSQIKLKFNNARFYSNSPHEAINNAVENKINQLVKEYDKAKKESI